MSSASAGDTKRANVLSIKPGTGQVPPHSTEAENAVLGAMLLDKEAVSKVLEILDPECFYHERHATIFRMMLEMFNRGVTIDLVTLSNELQRHDALERVGGMATLAICRVALCAW